VSSGCRSLRRPMLQTLSPPSHAAKASPRPDRVTNTMHWCGTRGALRTGLRGCGGRGGLPAADVPDASSGRSRRAPPGPARTLHASRWPPAPAPPPRTSAHRLRARSPSEERPKFARRSLGDNPCTRYHSTQSVSHRRCPPPARVAQMTEATDGAALTADEAKIYDRQIRVWGVETQQRCVLPSSRSPLLSTVLTGALPARADRSSSDSSVARARCSGVANWTDSDRVRRDGRLRSAKVLFVGCPGVSAEVPP